MTRNEVLLSGSASSGRLWITGSGSTRREREVPPLLLGVVAAIGTCPVVAINVAPRPSRMVSGVRCRLATFPHITLNTRVIRVAPASFQAGLGWC